MLLLFSGQKTRFTHYKRFNPEGIFINH